MIRTTLKLVMWLVGGHFLFGLILMVINEVHKINDQDITFAIALLFYYLNYSGVCLLRYMGIEPSLVSIFLAAIPQWLGLALIIAGIVRVFRGKKSKPKGLDS